MFSQRVKSKYKLRVVTLSEEEKPIESDEVTEAQAAVFKTMIDGIDGPDALAPDLEKIFYDSAIEIDTFRDAVRYAQDRLAAILIAVTEQDIECERLGMPEMYGKYFHVYRGIIENKGDNGGRAPFPRGQHIGDEAWLANADPKELFQECQLCVNERYYMEATWANMDKFIKVHHGHVQRVANGLYHVYKRPEPKPEEDEKDEKDEKALVKMTGGLRTARLARMVRGGRGGRAEGGDRGGGPGRSKGSPPFRGWKS